MPVINIHKIDWFRILTDLSRSGYSLQDIADELDVVASTLIGWKKGASPRHHSGEALIELWCRVTEKGRHQLPREKFVQKFIFHSSETCLQAFRKMNLTRLIVPVTFLPAQSLYHET